MLAHTSNQSSVSSFGFRNDSPQFTHHLMPNAAGLLTVRGSSLTLNNGK